MLIITYNFVHEVINYQFSNATFFLLQYGKLRAEVPFNSTYWAPFDAHNPGNTIQ